MLQEFLAFPSVSTDKTFQPAIKQTADWLTELFKRQGFTIETWNAPGCNPVVYARYKVAGGAATAPTTLIYGHYDVQPATQEDGWESDPFTLVERDGRLFGRGVVDNKGQILVHMATAFALIQAGSLTHNLIFLIEGNEETGSPGLGELVRQNKAKLLCDQVLVSDGEIPYRPTIEASLRGGFNLRIHYRTAASNLHSGVFGGAIPNAAHELNRLLAGLYDGTRVTIPGFYDNVDEITKEQRVAAQELYRGDTELAAATGIASPLTPKGYNFIAATGLLPTLQISGVSSGYTGPGFANIVPATAEARLNIRTVSSQKTAAVELLVTRYITEHTPPYVECHMETETADDPVRLPVNTPLARNAQKLLQQAYGTAPILSFSGGSIPIVGQFQRLLGVPCLLVGLGNDDCNIHGINENFELTLLKKGLEFSRLFFSQQP